MAGSRNSSKRRVNGEGCIRFREDKNLWVGVLSLGSNGIGKRVTRTVYGKTQGDVVKKMEVIRQEKRDGNLVDMTRMKLSELIDLWHEADASRLEAVTMLNRESNCRSHIIPRIGHLRITSINPAGVQAFYKSMRKDGVGQSAQSVAAGHLVSVLNYAVKMKWLKVNPARDVPRPREPDREMLTLTVKQAQILFEAVSGRNIHSLIALALGSGCRISELLALHWTDVDLNAKSIRIRRAIVTLPGKGRITKEPKTRAGRRTITLPSFSVEAILSQQKLTSGSALLFPSKSDGYKSGNSISTSFQRALRAANRKGAAIPAGFRFHDLRHTCASWLISSGHSLRAVSQRLGHSDPAMTLRVYSHCLPGDDQKLADGLDKMIQEGN